MEITFETLQDVCPVCNSHGNSPCYDEDGNDTCDHAGRGIATQLGGE